MNWVLFQIVSFDSFGYILKHRPFRETSLIVDIFTQDYGLICCIARPAKKRGKILKANLQSFRYLHLQWLGKGSMQTLTEVDERGKHNIPASEMMLGLYLNELLLSLLHPHIASHDVFSAYKYTLHKLADPSISHYVMMRFELYLLANLGYPISLDPETIRSEKEYVFVAGEGLLESDDRRISTIQQPNKPKIRGNLLLTLQDIQNMQESDWKALRVFLDQVFQLLVAKPLEARKLLKF